MTIENETQESKETQVGRNEPCPCGSGKKYKRCHGVSAAPKLTVSNRAPMPEMGPNEMPPGMPPGVTPEMMMQVSQMLTRLPKGQLQRLQSIMQRAMAGKDVSKEAQEFEKTLPPDFQQMMMGFNQTLMAGMGQGAETNAPIDVTSTPAPDLLAAPASVPSMSEDEARRIVEQAAAAGKISEDEAQKLLTGSENAASGDKSSGGIGKFWKNLTGKKEST